MSTEQAWQSVQQLLVMMRQYGGSDMFITAEFSPAIKQDEKPYRCRSKLSPRISAALWCCRP